MSDKTAPWWQDVHAAAAELTETVTDEVAQAREKGTSSVPEKPAQRTRTRTRARRPASLRHIAEVIRGHRWYTGVGVDKDVVRHTLNGDPRLLGNEHLVTAVIRACRVIAGAELDRSEADALVRASNRVRDLVTTAEEQDARQRLLPVPRAGSVVVPPPARPKPDAPRGRGPGRRRLLLVLAAVVLVLGSTVAVLIIRADSGSTAEPAAGDLGCYTGAGRDDILAYASTFDDDTGTRITPVLDFDSMNGSARYARHGGRTYYWGRAGSDDDQARAGGARVRWQPQDGKWRSCPATLPVTERGYVHTPAVPTTIGGTAVRVQICLWRDTPYRENCTATLG